MTRVDGFIASLPLCQFCANVQKIAGFDGICNKEKRPSVAARPLIYNT